METWQLALWIFGIPFGGAFLAHHLHKHKPWSVLWDLFWLAFFAYNLAEWIMEVAKCKWVTA